MQSCQGHGHLTCLLVKLFVWPEHRAEAGEHQGAQTPGPLLIAAVVVQGVRCQHEPVLPRTDPGGLHAAPHLPLQPAWEGEPSALTDIHPTSFSAQGRVCTGLTIPLGMPQLGHNPTFHESIRVILHWAWALLHDEAAHLLCNKQGPEDNKGLSSGIHGGHPQSLSRELASGLG